MPASVLEIAIYVMVLSGGQPTACESRQKPEPHVLCSDGTKAFEREEGRLIVRDDIAVLKGPDGSLAFSNGLRSFWGSAGWVQFSNGVSVRRNRDGSFKSNYNVVCAAASETKATCRPS
jgi:hypothetical protein